jgi:FlaA1/EpsC-like NDP-sugar epimerase
MINIFDFVKKILHLPRFVKQCLVFCLDLLLCYICVVAAFYLRLDTFIFLKDPVILSTYASIFLVIPIFLWFGLYRVVFRFAGSGIIFLVLKAALTYSFLYFCIINLYGIKDVPRSIGILQPIILLIMIIGSRLLVKQFISLINNKYKFTKITLVYGAGNAGRQLAASLEVSFEFKVVGFLDDDEKLQGKVLEGHEVYSPNNLEKLIKTKNVDLILLALPSVKFSRRKKIINKLSKHKLIIKTLPSIIDIVEDKVTILDIKELAVNDILNREIIPPKKDLIYKNITSQVVLVTGAGGSIGSELCRQILSGNPKTLILCEFSEFALYKIYEDLKILNKKLKIIPILTNVQDEQKINEVIKIFKIDTIYHAAAFKHVPIVEANICEGVLNNIFGTLIVAKAAINHSVSNFVLISTDKAVRPTNIMGATKRLAEICVQSLYHYNKKTTKMSIVRFGNVIESSGSFIPKLKKQISLGGPVTLTHPDVSRYFMTTPEAAELVMHAGAMSENCEVFVLEMGERVKIKELIYKIIQLSGLRVKDKDNPRGDIEVKIIGLRPGEKLNEELQLGDNPQETFHEKIKKAQDPFIPYEKLNKDLDNLYNLSKYNKISEAKYTLSKLIPSYKSNLNIVDHIFQEKMLSASASSIQENKIKKIDVE